MKIKKMLPMNQLRAVISDSSFNEEDRTVEIVWTTGAKGLRYGWDGRYYEELEVSERAVDMSRLSDGAPFLAVHNDRSLDAVVGVVERAWLEDGQGKAIVRFAKDEISERIFQKVKDRILRNISVGYRVDEYTDVTREGEEIPTYRATRWQPMELSLVPIGFDAGAKIRSQENQPENEVTIITRSVELTKENNLMGKEEKDLSSQPQQQAAAPAIDIEALKREAAEQERQRVLEIKKAVRDAGLDEKLADEYITRGISSEQAKVNIEMFAKYAAAPQVDSTVRVQTGVDERDKKRDAIVEAILYRIDSQNFKPSQGNPYLGMSLLRMMEEFHPNRYGMTDAMLARNAMSSSDLPYILSNVAEKAAQKKYELQPRTWSRWAKTATLRNYKTKDLVRSGDFASLQERKENGEFKRGSFGEEREQVQLKDHGIIMPFTRQMLINDDLGEIAKVTAQAGVAASRLENRLVYEQLKNNPTMGDGVALFHSSHGNLGTPDDIDDTSIGEAFKLMRKQQTVDKLDYLNLTPKYFICGPENEQKARKFLASITPTKTSDVNLFTGSMELIVDAEITDKSFYFAADPNLIDTVILYHLEGEEKPRVETRVDFETEAVEIKCAHAAAAKAVDWRGLVKNAGPQQ